VLEEIGELELEHGRLTVARSSLERALATVGHADEHRRVRASICRHLAHTLNLQGEDPERVRELAAEASGLLRELGLEEDARAVSAWLATAVP
jgi:hypothetical protein